MTRKTWITFMLFTMLLIGMANLVYASISIKNPGIEVTVQEGETLWDLATRFHGQVGMSTQELLFYITKENKLETATIHPGDHIRIPVK